MARKEEEEERKEGRTNPLFGREIEINYLPELVGKRKKEKEREDYNLL